MLVRTRAPSQFRLIFAMSTPRCRLSAKRRIGRRDKRSASATCEESIGALPYEHSALLLLPVCPGHTCCIGQKAKALMFTRKHVDPKAELGEPSINQWVLGATPPNCD